jgi:predicted DNA-binding helix-hairpin-helix protein
MDERLSAKLRILADAAKYDASCASSGAPKRVAGKGGIGSTTGSGICHAYTPDGRCVSLLKILLTNYCLYDCAYCVNRRSSNTPRARFTVDEVVTLTLEFYKRNYIEGLFLSSGIVRSPDHTMEQLMLVARKLRRDEGFMGYIHLKTIPEAKPVADRAGRPLGRPPLDQPRAADRRRALPPRAGESRRPTSSRRWARPTSASSRPRPSGAASRPPASRPR